MRGRARISPDTSNHNTAIGGPLFASSRSGKTSGRRILLGCGQREDGFAKRRELPRQALCVTTAARA